MTAENGYIAFEIQGGVARISLARPPLNILNIAMMEELSAVLERTCTRQDIKLVVLDHEGRAFSAGVDIKDHTKEKVGRMIEVFHQIFDRLAALEPPTLAVADGAALGGGCELATFCDLVVASERATFGQPEIKVGVFPPVAAVVLPRLIGRNRCLELLLTGEVISATEAKRIGLINQVFPDADFREEVERLVAKLAGLSGPVLKLTKRAVDQALESSFGQRVRAVERIYLDELMQTEDAAEGLEAFLEKRPPRWKER